ncbi:MAG TPA: DUF2867 domain-containing protein [Mycobacteriales bacterium]|nr:DUF2867 domain-containing protein [Mycobacteriales bacterium]
MAQAEPYRDERTRPVGASPAALWRVIEGIGGARGWHSPEPAWIVRGAVDRLVGGIGRRRGRRDPDRLAPGDQLDFWQVEEVRRGELLRLRAEMRLPGVAWLDLRIDRNAAGTVLHQRTTFRPRGPAGHLYWWASLPLHKAVFARMATNIAAAARRLQDPAEDPPDSTQDPT